MGKANITLTATTRAAVDRMAVRFIKEAAAANMSPVADTQAKACLLASMKKGDEVVVAPLVPLEAITSDNYDLESYRSDGRMEEDIAVWEKQGWKKLPASPVPGWVRCIRAVPG